MIAESWAILCIVSVMAYFVNRRGRPVTALTLLPLLLVPLSYIIGRPLGWWIAQLISAELHVVRLGILMVGLVLSCILYGICSKLYHSRSSRSCYLVMCGGFSTILSLIYLLFIVRQ